MPHHGHFVQSRLPVEDDDVSVAHVPLHLGREADELRGRDLLRREASGPEMLCRWEQTTEGCDFMGNTYQPPLRARHQVRGGQSTASTSLKELCRRRKPRDSARKAFCSVPPWISLPCHTHPGCRTWVSASPALGARGQQPQLAQESSGLWRRPRRGP